MISLLVDLGPLWATLVLSLFFFVILWPLSVFMRDASVVDFWWGPGFLALVGIAAMIPGRFGPHAVIVLALVGVWAVRLGWVMIARRFAAGVEDPRYTALRRTWDPGFWWKSFFVVFVLQAVVQWVIALGAILVQSVEPVDIGLLALAGAGTAFCGLTLETVADYQLDRFKRVSAEGALCQTGLRAIIRHPNYLGEMIFWWGIAAVVMDAGLWHGVPGAILLSVLLLRVSGIPMLDEHMRATRPDYAEYCARVPALLPRPGTRALEHQ